jgi:hypothetical protein
MLKCFIDKTVDTHISRVYDDSVSTHKNYVRILSALSLPCHFDVNLLGMKTALQKTLENFYVQLKNPDYWTKFITSRFDFNGVLEQLEPNIFDPHIHAAFQINYCPSEYNVYSHFKQFTESEIVAFAEQRFSEDCTFLRNCYKIHIDVTNAALVKFVNFLISCCDSNDPVIQSAMRGMFDIKFRCIQTVATSTPNCVIYCMPNSSAPQKLFSLIYGYFLDNPCICVCMNIGTRPRYNIRVLPNLYYTAGPGYNKDEIQMSIAEIVYENPGVKDNGVNRTLYKGQKKFDLVRLFS